MRGKVRNAGKLMLTPRQKTKDGLCADKGKKALRTLVALSEHLLDLSHAYGAAVVKFFTPILYRMARRIYTNAEMHEIFPTSKKNPEAVFETITHLFETMQDFQTACHVADLQPVDIAICRLILLLFPISDFRHPLLTPLMLLLDQWVIRLSEQPFMALEPTHNASGSLLMSCASLPQPFTFCTECRLALALLSIWRTTLSPTEHERYAPSFFTLALRTEASAI